jgi:AraC-like DNA-binding protein
MALIAQLDPSQVPAGQQSQCWTGGIKRYFPGVTFLRSPTAPILGSAHGYQLGPAQLWRIVSPNQTVHVRGDAVLGMDSTFSIIVQSRGFSLVKGDHAHRIDQGTLSINNGANTCMELAGSSTQVLLHVPRSIVLARHPGLKIENLTMIDPQEPGAILLKAAVMLAARTAHRLSDTQAAIVFASILQLIGAPDALGPRDNLRNSWRARRAMADIECGFRIPEFDAERVATAQTISRRRLDTILIENTGKSLTAHIWDRRLAQAAEDLLDHAKSHKRISEIAFALGFEHIAHFCRAFKQRFRVTPTHWRSG